METIEFPRATRADDDKAAMLRRLEDYWHTLRHTRRLPARCDIAPDQLDHVLPHAFILQRVAPGTARFRVAGQRLHDLLKMDARGLPLSVLFAPEARPVMQDIVEQAFAGPAIVELALRSEPSRFRSPITGRMLLLPMRDQHDQASRLLGAIVTDPVTGNRPQRFMIPHGRATRQDPLGPRLATSTGPLPAFAKQKGPDAARPTLKLVVNND